MRADIFITESPLTLASLSVVKIKLVADTSSRFCQFLILLSLFLLSWGAYAAVPPLYEGEEEYYPDNYDYKEQGFDWRYEISRFEVRDKGKTLIFYDTHGNPYRAQKDDTQTSESSSYIYSITIEAGHLGQKQDQEYFIRVAENDNDDKGDVINFFDQYKYFRERSTEYAVMRFGQSKRKFIITKTKRLSLHDYLQTNELTDELIADLNDIRASLEAMVKGKANKYCIYVNDETIIVDNGRLHVEAAQFYDISNRSAINDYESGFEYGEGSINKKFIDEQLALIGTSWEQVWSKSIIAGDEPLRPQTDVIFSIRMLMNDVLLNSGISIDKDSKRLIIEAPLAQEPLAQDIARKWNTSYPNRDISIIEEIYDRSEENESEFIELLANIFEEPGLSPDSLSLARKKEIYTSPQTYKDTWASFWQSKEISPEDAISWWQKLFFQVFQKQTLPGSDYNTYVVNAETVTALLNAADQLNIKALSYDILSDGLNNLSPDNTIKNQQLGRWADIIFGGAKPDQLSVDLLAKLIDQREGVHVNSVASLVAAGIATVDEIGVGGKRDYIQRIASIMPRAESKEEVNRIVEILSEQEMPPKKSASLLYFMSEEYELAENKLTAILLRLDENLRKEIKTELQTLRRRCDLCGCW